MTVVHPIRDRHVDAVFVGRARYLMDLLAVAQDEMVVALTRADVEAGKAAARKLASIGWLFREAADKHEGSTLCACGHEADWHSRGGAGDCEHDPGCHCNHFSWPVHQPAAPEAPIPGIHWYSGCDPDRPRVNPATGICEGCGETGCPTCGREACPDHFAQHQTGPGASLLEDRGTGARKEQSR